MIIATISRMQKKRAYSRPCSADSFPGTKLKHACYVVRNVGLLLYSSNIKFDGGIFLWPDNIYSIIRAFIIIFRSHATFTMLTALISIGRQLIVYSLNFYYRSLRCCQLLMGLQLWDFETLLRLMSVILFLVFSLSEWLNYYNRCT